MRARSLWIVALTIAVLAWALGQARRASELRANGPQGFDTTAARDTGRAEPLTVRLYFASPGGDSLLGETRTVSARPGLHGRVEVLVRELVRGARHGGVPLLPPGTSVRHVYVDHRGLMTLDLTPAFRDRFHGGSTAEYFALGSLVRTLLDNVPEARAVRFACAGEPLETLGGHFACDPPFERADF